jgi:predicted ArsR family transcriptional regulator
MSLPNRIIELLKAEPLTGNQIAERLQHPAPKVRQALWKMRDSGKVESDRKATPSLSIRGPRTLTIWKIKE